MGKRKHSKDDSYEHIAKKLKKLERKLKRSRKRRHDSTSSTSTGETHEVSSKNEDDSPIEFYPHLEDEDVDILEPTATLVSPEPGPSTSAEPAPCTNAVEPAPSMAGQDDERALTPKMDKGILDLLGDDPSVTKSYGKEINPDLAVRLQHIVTTGLSKELRKDLQGKYLPPSNCTHIDAPLLNPEIKAAITDIVLKRDRGIEIKQKELGSAIACIGEAVSILLNEEDKNTAVIKLLMDASRLICDCQNTDSITRRNFILYNLKKDLKEQIRKAKIDNFLFGSDLAETLKTAKSISKSGADLKSTPAQKISQNVRQHPVSSSQTTQRNHLNWKAPPPGRRPKGTQKRKEPAQRGQHVTFSRPSYRAPPPQQRSRP